MESQNYFGWNFGGDLIQHSAQNMTLKLDRAT